MEEAQKLHAFDNITSDLHLLIDSHLDCNKISTLRKRHRQLLSRYTIHGTPTKTRGVLAFLKRNNGCSISEVTTNNNQDTLLFKLTLPDTSTVDIMAVYAPSKDRPEFWENTQTLLNNAPSTHKILIGDFNVTLNHSTDSTGYDTDPHKKSRKILQSYLDNEELIDSYRHFNPDKKEYSFRTKNCHKRARLDYGLVSPSLIQHITSTSFTAHNFGVTDHSSYTIKLDLTKSETGRGTFRCTPNLQHNTNYQALIKNCIKKSIFQSIKKTETSTVQEAMMDARIRLQEEIHAIETLVPTWKTEQRKSTLNTTIAVLLSMEPTAEELLTQEMDIGKAALLEYILNNMKSETIKFTKNMNKENTNNLKETKAELQELLSKEDTLENLEDIEAKEDEVDKMEKKLIYDVLAKKHTFLLLDDEKPTKTFLQLESSKSGYSEITRIRIKNTNYDANKAEDATNQQYFQLTEPPLIRAEMHRSFKEIYSIQTNLNRTQTALEDFLNSDNDTEPLEELKRRIISKEESEKWKDY